MFIVVKVNNYLASSMVYNVDILFVQTHRGLTHTGSPAVWKYVRRAYTETYVPFTSSLCKLRMLIYFSCDQAALCIAQSVCLSICDAFLHEASFGLRVLSLPASVCVRPCVNHELVCAITHHPIRPGSPNLGHRCKRLYSRSLSFLGVIDLDLQGQILTSKSKFTSFWACPCDNSSPVRARTTKLGPEVQNTLVKIPYSFWGWLSLTCQI